MNITLRMREKMVFIAASDKPSILKLTFLQLIFFCFNCCKSSSFESVFDKSSIVHANDSLKKNLKDNYIEVNFITHCASFYRFSMIDENPLPSNNWADDDFEYCINLLNLPYKLACKTDSIIFHKIGQTYKLEDNPNYDNISVIGNVYGDYLAHLITIKNFYSLPILFYWIIINSVKFFYQVVINNRKNIITGFILLFKLLKDSLKFNEYNRIVNYRAINIYK